MLTMNCLECDKRETCKVLCKDAEAYVRQDHTRRRESLLRSSDNLAPREWPSITTYEAIIKYYFSDRLTQRDIAKKLGITQQYVSKIVSKSKQIILSNIRK
jgi:DNA-directed RNA polymerase specialized sigma subunit